MKVILLQNIKGIGRMGDIKDVSDGYGRNFLLAKKLGKLANEGTIKEIEVLKKKGEVEKSEEFKKLSPKEQVSAKSEYFDSVVAPKVPKEDLDFARNEFFGNQQRRDTIISAGKPIQRNIIGRLFGASPEEQRAKAMNQYAISQSTGIPIQDVVRLNLTQNEQITRMKKNQPATP